MAARHFPEKRGRKTKALIAPIPSEELIAPLLTEKAERISAFKKRGDSFIHESFHPADLQSREGEGWELERESKTRVRMKRKKAHDRELEDQSWCLFYRMGYPEVNGDNFKISYTRVDGSIGSKQVDVFAKDNETVVIVECKSREVRGRRTLQKDLHETEALQRPLANTIRKHYGQEFRPKIIWLYITRNIIWSDPDLERASAAGIRVITENEMQYFDSFIRHMGPAGRYQFLAEFLEKQPIPELSNVKVPAIRGKLGGNLFYCFVTTPRTLLKIAFVNHQALNHPDGRPAYQRMITPSRIREIEGFIKGGGFFPTNILINFTEECRFDLLPNKENSDPAIKFGTLYLPNTYKSAWIIDGQHRLYGYSHLDEEWLDQNLAIIAFQEMDTKDEADLFVTINQKQKSVQRSVIVSLQSDLKWGSSDPRERVSALASAIVKALNSDPTSPFFQRFALQGVATKESQSLTFPEFVNGLARSALVGRALHKTQLAPGYLSSATDEQTVARAKRVLNGYFNKIRDANPDRWERGRETYICVNPGIRAHLLLISDLLAHITMKKGIDVLVADEGTLLSNIEKLLKPLATYIREATDEDVSEKFSRRFGEGGVIDYFDHLCTIVRSQETDFGSPEFLERLSKKNDDRVTQTHQDVIKLSQDISDYVIYKLKEKYGTGEDESGEKAWWELGIESQKAKENAYKRYLEGLKDKKLPKEAYLDILDYRDIVRQKSNWPTFESVFNIPLPNEKGKTYYLDWMERFNKIRRIPAHASGVRGYDEDDYAFMRHIKAEFYNRLKSSGWGA